MTPTSGFRIQKLIGFTAFLFVVAACDPRPKIDVKIDRSKIKTAQLNVPEMSEQELADLMKFLQDNKSDPSFARLLLIMSTTGEDFKDLSLRLKLIRSRALVLGAMDLLPPKGNPYYHMVDFSQAASKNPYNAAQNNDKADAEYKKLIDDKENPVWLPVAPGKSITAERIAVQDVADIYNYFSLYVSITDQMEKTVLPLLKNSIIVPSLEESLDAHNNIYLKKHNKELFYKVWARIQKIRDEYKTLLQSSPVSKAVLDRSQKQAQLTMASSLATGMKPYITYVETAANKVALNNFVSKVEALQSASVDAENLQNTKQQVAILFNPNSVEFITVKNTLSTVDLPDSGDIDGADEAFEVAMRLQVGFEILNQLSEDVKNW